MTINLTSWADQFQRIQKLSTSVTLVSSSILVPTLWTGSLDKSVGQESIVLLTIQLLHSFLDHKSLISDLQEHLLSDLRLSSGSCSTKIIEANIKPLIDTFVQSMVFVAKLLGRHALLEGFRFRGGTVLISTADV
jgi:hypothetical protein